MINKRRVIDFHTHTFPDKISERVVQKLAGVSHTRAFTRGSASDLIASMRKSGVNYSVNLPVMTSVEQVSKVNQGLICQKDSLEASGILTFGGMHPDCPDYKEELIRLKDAGIPGIKLHPAYQNVDLDDIRMLRIIDMASELNLIVLVHAGIDIGIYDHNYSSVKHVLHLLDQINPYCLVLAHMGGWACWDDVEQHLAGAPVWFDTAFSLGAVTRNPGDDGIPYREQNLSNKDFIRLCRKHGTDHILFATDSPWEGQEDYLARIQSLSLTEQELDQILWKNAAGLLSIH